jgi:hypothetical protein
MPHYVQRTETLKSSSRQPGEPVVRRTRSVPIAYVVFAVGLVESVACRVACEVTGVREIAFWMMLSLAVSQVELAGGWLIAGRRRLIVRLPLCAALPLVWSCIFRSLPILQLPWLPFLSALTSIVVVAGLVGRLLGLELREVPSATVPLPCEGPNTRRLQFSIADLLALTLMVAVVFAPFRPGLDLNSVVGKPTWLDVGYTVVMVAVIWVIVRSAKGVGRARGRRGRSSEEVNFSVWLTGSRRTNSLDGHIEYFVLLVLALAWLLGPLRDAYDHYRSLGQSLEWVYGLSIPLVVSASWTLAIAWAMLAGERQLSRWGPCAVVHVLGVICLAISLRWSNVAGELLPVLLLQTPWSLLTLLLVRRAGYRLCRVTRK